MCINIMVADEKKSIADLIEVYLQNEDYKVFKCFSGKEALECIENERLDMAIFDVMLPGVDGFTLCQKIRATWNYPIIILTEKDAEIDKITGLTLGADDYMTKPFSPLELLARVKAQLRRFTKYNHTPTTSETQEESDNRQAIVISDLFMNKKNHQCLLNKTPLHLTPTEFSILWVLCQNQGQVVSSDRLFYEVWGEKYYTSSNNTIMVHIRHLREKMKDSAENPKYIKTVWGVGYKIEK